MTQHHWHADRSKDAPRQAEVDGILCGPVVCCHCGSRQYAQLVPETMHNCGMSIRGTGRVVEIDRFVPIPDEAIIRRRPKRRA